MLRALISLGCMALAHAGATIDLLMNEPIILYSDLSPKLRIITKNSAFGGVMPNDIELVFSPRVEEDVFSVNVANDLMLTLSLNPGKKWLEAPDAAGTALYLVDVKIRGESRLGGAEDVALVVPTPTVTTSDQIIYMTGTRQFVINGTNFNPKTTSLIFEPPLIRNQDYLLNVASKNTLVLTRATGRKWRADPGPLKLRRIDTGGGQLRVNPLDNGLLVAEVQADLDVHGVTVESTPNERSYQSTGRISVIGTGFNPVDNHMRFANGLRGHGVNYTAVEHTASVLTLELKPGHKWRKNAANLPGPLNLLAVDAGGGFVAVGPTEAKKGRPVATIFEDVEIEPHPETIVYSGHTHEVWIVGKGFTRGDYKTQLSFDPPLEERIPMDITMLVFNRTHIRLTLFEGEHWLDKKVTQPLPLRVKTVNTGPGPVTLHGDGSSLVVPYRTGKGVVVATLMPDEKQHADVQVYRSTSQSVYQTALLKDVVVLGKGFVDGMALTFDNGLLNNVDYTMKVDSPEQCTLSLKPNRKWRVEGGALKVLSVHLPKEDEAITVGSGGMGVAVAEILDDPFITSGERIIFATHTKQLTINGYGFVLDDTRVTLSPTLPDAYYIDSVEPYRLVLRLRDGFSWDDNVFEKGASQDIYVTKIDTRAGEILMNDGNGVAVAKVEADLDDNQCDDSCEYAFDGLCDDGSASEQSMYDDDYGGYYGYDDGQYYDYGYYYYGDDYYGDDTFLAAICDVGTDCTDCGGPTHASEVETVDCDNSCQWANDGFCDDDRTSGLCKAGTDCHDCGTLGASNFTSLFGDDWEWNEESENFWDDDDAYWAGDDELAYAPLDALEDSGRLNDGVGSLFINAMQAIVYFVGFVFCSGGAFIGYKMLTGDAAGAFAAFPDATDTIASKDGAKDRLLSAGKAAVPITPDDFTT